MGTLRLSTAATAAMLLVAPLPAFAAYRCPASEPNKADLPDLAGLPLTAEEPSVRRAALASIDRLRDKGVPNGAIVDQVVGAYCARSAAQGDLADAARDRQVRRFAANVAAIVYGSPAGGTEDIIVDVPVPTALHDEMARAARQASLSEDQWTIQAIKAHLAADKKAGP